MPGSLILSKYIPRLIWNLGHSLHYFLWTFWSNSSWIFPHQHPSSCFSNQSKEKNCWRWHCFSDPWFFYHCLNFFWNLQIIWTLFHYNKIAKIKTHYLQYLSQSLSNKHFYTWSCSFFWFSHWLSNFHLNCCNNTTWISHHRWFQHTYWQSFRSTLTTVPLSSQQC